MLSKTFRIGPLFLIEMMACVVGVMLYTIFGKRCWSLALVQCALSIYLVESLIAYHIIHKSKKHRRQYLCKLAASPNSKLYTTLVWNQFILMMILTVFAVLTIDDFIRLLHNETMQQCVFKLYPLCLQYESEISMKKSIDMAQMWLLFVFCTCFNFFLLILLQVKQYRYTFTILRNRRNLARQYLGSEALLSSTAFYQEIYQPKSINNSSYRHNEQCSICLSEIVKGDLITNLQCKHGFHSVCLTKWLEKRKQCPFRCEPNSHTH